MKRALRAAIVGVALFSPVALSACSAGQVAQTATQERDQTGSMAQVGDLVLRQVQLVNPRGGSYDAGDDAELRLTVVNTGTEADTLLSVEGEGFRSAEISGSTTGATSGGTSAGTSSDEIELPPGQTVFVGPRDPADPARSGDVTVALTGLDESLTVGQYVRLVLSFENAGEVTVMATVATPDSEVDRAEGFDFHEEEGGESGDEIARERESAVGDGD